MAILLGLGGTILVAFYFLKKSKPNLSEEQLAKLNTDTVLSAEQQLVLPPSAEIQKQRDKCDGLTSIECEQLIAKLDRQNAIANGTPIVSTYISEGGFAPRVDVFSTTRAGITYNLTTPTPTPTTPTRTSPTTTSTPTTSTTTSNTRVSSNSGGRRF